jgi:hypothetical protein
MECVEATRARALHIHHDTACLQQTILLGPVNTDSY